MLPPDVRDVEPLDPHRGFGEAAKGGEPFREPFVVRLLLFPHPVGLRRVPVRKLHEAAPLPFPGSPDGDAMSGPVREENGHRPGIRNPLGEKDLPREVDALDEVLEKKGADRVALFPCHPEMIGVNIR